MLLVGDPSVLPGFLGLFIMLSRFSMSWCCQMSISFVCIIRFRSWCDPPISNEVTDSKRSVWLYRFFIGFYTFVFWVFGFHSTVGATGRHKIGVTCSPSFLYIGVTGLICWINLWHTFSAVFIIVPHLCMLHHILHCIFSCYVPSTYPCLRCLYSCS